MDLTTENISALAEQKEDENWDFRAFLKWGCKLSGNKLDSLVSEITDNISSQVDCTACGRCCLELKPGFSDTEQRRLAERLGISLDEIRQQYLKHETIDGDTAWRTCRIPCPFLDGTQCSVYEDRPEECRCYPYLHESDFTRRTMGMIERTFTCPIVFHVMEELKKQLHYRYRRR